MRRKAKGRKPSRRGSGGRLGCIGVRRRGMPPRRSLGSETPLSGGTSGNAAGPRISPVARSALPPAARNRGKLARKVAPALLRAHIAFRDELGVGSLDRDDAHAEVAREGSLGGKLFIRQDVPVGDIVADAPIKVVVTARVPSLIHVVRQHFSPSPQSGLIYYSQFDHVNRFKPDV